MEKLRALLKEFEELKNKYDETFDAKSIVEKINQNRELRETFVNAFIDMIRDDMLKSDLTDFVDCSGDFGYEKHVSKILDTIINMLKMAIEYKINF